MGGDVEYKLLAESWERVNLNSHSVLCTLVHELKHFSSLLKSLKDNRVVSPWDRISATVNVKHFVMSLPKLLEKPGYDHELFVAKVFGSICYLQLLGLSGSCSKNIENNYLLVSITHLLRPRKNSSVQNTVSNDTESGLEMNDTGAIKYRNALLDYFLQFVKVFPLCNETRWEARESLVSELRRLLQRCCDGNAKVARELYKRDTCYKIMRVLLLSPVQKADFLAESLINKNVRELILMKPSDGTQIAQTPAQPYVKSSKEATDFVCDLMTQREKFYINVTILVQHLCERAIEKEKYRARAAEAVFAIVTHDEYVEKARTFTKAYLLNNLTITSQAAHRLMGLIVVEKLLLEGGGVCGSFPPGELVPRVLSRCYDKAPAVRAKAFSCIASLAACGREEITGVLRRMLHNFSDCLDTAGSQPEDRPPADCFESLVRRRLRDKLSVRKEALRALTSTWAHLPAALHLPAADSLLQVYDHASRDESLVMRRESALCLRTLLQAHPMNQQIQHCWLQFALPLLKDGEPSVVEAQRAACEALVLDKLLLDTPPDAAGYQLAWCLLDEVACQDHHRAHLHRTLQAWLAAQAGRDKKGLVKQLLRRIDERGRGNKPAGCWLLLATFMINTEQPLIVSETRRRLSTYLELTSWSGREEAEFRFVLEIVSLVTPRSTQCSDLAELVAPLTCLLHDPGAPSGIIRHIVSSLFALWGNFGLQSRKLSFASEVLHSVEEATKGGVGLAAAAAAGLVRQLLVLGDVLLWEPRVPPSAPVLHTLSTILRPPGGQSTAVDCELREAAVVALGKMCLVNCRLAHQYAGLMLEPLADPDSCPLGLANNAVIVFCDLYVRCGSRLDRYLPHVYSYLSPTCPHARMRYTTLSCLFQLVKEDYIKLRGGGGDSLFFRMARLYVDEDEQVAALAEFCLLQLEKHKKGTFFSHLVHAIFFLNEYRRNPRYNNFSCAGGFVRSWLAGEGRGADRLLVYQLLASRMTDHQKFMVKCKLMTEVVGLYTSEDESAEKCSDDLLSDTFRLLVLKEMKLSFARDVAAAEGGDETDVFATADQSATSSGGGGSSGLAKAVKEKTLEHFVPILLKTREVLKGMQGKAGLLAHLMAYLGDVMRELRGDICPETEREISAEVGSGGGAPSTPVVREYSRLSSSASLRHAHTVPTHTSFDRPLSLDLPADLPVDRDQLRSPAFVHLERMDVDGGGSHTPRPPPLDHFRTCPKLLSPLTVNVAPRVRHPSQPTLEQEQSH